MADFDNTNGNGPLGTLVQGFDGNFYGTTWLYLSTSATIFKITPGGAITSFYTFCTKANCADGTAPYAGLVQATNGDFYGTTFEGGAFGPPCKLKGCGTVFKITPSGTLTTLHSFLTDGDQPRDTLVQGIDGNLYGTTSEGGSCLQSKIGCGTVFKITRAGVLTTIYNFCPQAGCTDGGNPQAGLVQGIDGDFYGTSVDGGINNDGTVFKITSAGALTTLYRFSGTDGSGPQAGLVLGSDGNFYGTTGGGGANQFGTVFKITPAGTLTTLYSFADSPSSGGLEQATDANFYGVTQSGGTYGYGTIFEITSTGTFSTLHDFDITDGQNPFGGLTQGTDGNLYGTTPTGGDLTCGATAGCGTVFKLSLGLAPFVETNLGAGKVGGEVIILGTDLTGATAVSFNGTAAEFTVVSATEITAKVPTGAKTGFIRVTTPGGTLKSNVRFLVFP